MTLKQQEQFAQELSDLCNKWGVFLIANAADPEIKLFTQKEHQYFGIVDWQESENKFKIV
jgi:hypothetical protein